MPPKALGARQDPPARTEDTRLEPPPMPQEPFMELEEVNWRLQVVMVPRRKVSERASRREKRRCSGRLGRCWAASSRHLYMRGEGGALLTADTGFPPDFVTAGPVRLPALDYSARGRLTLPRCSEFPPSFGACGPREGTQKPAGRDSGWAAGIGACSRSPRGQQGLGTGGCVAAASPGSESAHGESLPHGDSPSDAVPGVSGCSRGESARLALTGELCFAHCVT